MKSSNSEHCKQASRPRCLIIDWPIDAFNTLTQVSYITKSDYSAFLVMQALTCIHVSQSNSRDDPRQMATWPFRRLHVFDVVPMTNCESV